MEHPKLYKGIEYVSLNELPEDQQRKIRESLNQELFIKILVNGELQQNCILYKDYSQWFERVYSDSQPSAIQPERAPSPAENIAPLSVSVAKS